MAHKELQIPATPLTPGPFRILMNSIADVINERITEILAEKTKSGKLTDDQKSAIKNAMKDLYTEEQHISIVRLVAEFAEAHLEAVKAHLTEDPSLDLDSDGAPKDTVQTRMEQYINEWEQLGRLRRSDDYLHG